MKNSEAVVVNKDHLQELIEESFLLLCRFSEAKENKQWKESSIIAVALRRICQDLGYNGIDDALQSWKE